MLLMRQGEQAWLLTATGNHEFARVFWFDGDYRLREGFNRVGTSKLLNAALDDAGATLRWSCGRVTQIPRAWYHYTYLPAA